jgi:acetate kinase
MEGAVAVAGQERLILALNCGSSSLKYGVYRATDNNPQLVCEGEAEEITDHRAALLQALNGFARQGITQFWKAGHRVVHGGPEVREHQTLTPELFQKLQAAVPFAPLHLPASLAVIEAVREKMPALPQVICLDTAFHRTMPDVARTFALPAEVRKLGVERYGFHGLSMESILAQLHPVPEKLIVAHLGNGASITAIENGQSRDTTMGLTPTGGVMMGTRCGDLDPGVMLFLERHSFTQADALEELVDKKSGLLGVSGITNDVRILMQSRGQPPADLALRLFCYQVRKAIAAMAASLGGIDLLVFTGGIGEHAAELRKEICDTLTWLGSFKTCVLPAQEDLQIARIALSCSK